MNFIINKCFNIIQKCETFQKEKAIKAMMPVYSVVTKHKMLRPEATKI